MVTPNKTRTLRVPTAHIQTTMKYAIYQYITAANPQAQAYWFNLYRSC